jgi:hypothetical protein
MWHLFVIWWSPKQSRSCHLAVQEPSWFFHLTWLGGCYACAGDVEVSESCLFFMTFPARCIFSVSSRVYFRKHTLCFLPLVTILKSSSFNFFNINQVDYYFFIQRKKIIFSFQDQEHTVNELSKSSEYSKIFISKLVLMFSQI